MAASTQPNPKVAAAASRSKTSGVGPEAAREASLPRPYTSPKAEIGLKDDKLARKRRPKKPEPTPAELKAALDELTAEAPRSD